MGSTAAPIDAEPASAGRILLVDDEQRIVNFVRRGLEAEGLIVDVALDGKEGLQLAIEHAYDLVILDLVMPGPGGLEVLRRLVKSRPSQPVMILSALNDTTSKVSCLEHGAEDYVAKPFSLDELLARVRARLRAAARSTPPFLRAGTVTLDLLRRQADVGAGPVPLAHREFLLLRELIAQRRPHRVEGTPPLVGVGLPLRSSIQRRGRLRPAAPDEARLRRDHDRPRCRVQDR